MANLFGQTQQQASVQQEEPLDVLYDNLAKEIKGFTSPGLAGQPVTYVNRAKVQGLKENLLNRLKAVKSTDREGSNKALQVYLRDQIIPTVKRYADGIESIDPLRETEKMGSYADILNPPFLQTFVDLANDPRMEELNPQVRDEFFGELGRLRDRYTQLRLNQVYDNRQLMRAASDAAMSARDSVIKAGQQYLGPPEQVEELTRKAGLGSLKDAQRLLKTPEAKRSRELQDKINTLNQLALEKGLSNADVPIEDRIFNYIDLSDEEGTKGFIWRLLDTVAVADTKLIDSVGEKLGKILPDDGVVKDALREYRARGSYPAQPFIFDQDQAFSFGNANTKNFLETLDLYEKNFAQPGVDKNIDAELERILRESGVGIIPIKRADQRAAVLKNLAKAAGLVTGLSGDIVFSPSSYVTLSTKVATGPKKYTGITGAVIKGSKELDKYNSLNKAAKGAFSAFTPLKEAKKPGQLTRNVAGLRKPGSDSIIPLFDYTALKEGFYGGAGNLRKAVPELDFRFRRVNRLADRLKDQITFGSGVDETLKEELRRQSVSSDNRLRIAAKLYDEMEGIIKGADEPEIVEQLATVVAEMPDALSPQRFNPSATISPETFHAAEQARIFDSLGSVAKGLTIKDARRIVQLKRADPGKLSETENKIYELLNASGAEASLLENDVGKFAQIYLGIPQEKLVNLSRGDKEKVELAAEKWRELHNFYKTALETVEEYQGYYNSRQNYIPHVDQTKGLTGHPFFEKKRVFDTLYDAFLTGRRPVTNIRELSRHFVDSAESYLFETLAKDVVTSPAVSIKLGAEDFANFVQTGKLVDNIKPLVEKGLIEEKDFFAARAKAFSKLTPAQIRGQAIGALPTDMPDSEIKKLVSYTNLIRPIDEVQKEFSRWGVTKEKLIRIRESAIPGMTPETMLKDLGLEAYAPKGLTGVYPAVGFNAQDVPEEQLLQMLNQLRKDPEPGFVKLGDLMKQAKISPEDLQSKAGIEKLLGIMKNRPIFIMPASVATHFENVVGAIREMKRGGRIVDKQSTFAKTLKIYDSLASNVKGRALLSPGTISRNTQGSVFNYVLSGETSPKPWINAVDFMTNGTAEFSIQSKGKTIPAEELDKELKNMGVLRNIGVFTSEAARVESGVKPLDLVAKYDPLGMLAQAAAKANMWAENTSRAAMYIAKRERGLSPQEAITEVNKYLFDYEALSPVEKEWGRRLAFFYTWTRKTVPLMTQEALRKPGFFSSLDKLQAAMSNGQEVPQELLPEVLRDVGTVAWWQAAEDESKINSVAFDLPISHDFIGGLTQSERQSDKLMEVAKNLLNPLIPNAAEALLSGWDDPIIARAKSRTINPNMEGLFGAAQGFGNPLARQELTGGQKATAQALHGTSVVGALAGVEFPAVLAVAFNDSIRKYGGAHSDGTPLSVPETLDLFAGAPAKKYDLNKEGVDAILSIMPVATRLAKIIPTEENLARGSNYLKDVMSFGLGIRFNQLDPVQTQFLNSVLELKKVSNKVEGMDKLISDVNEKLEGEISPEVGDFITLRNRVANQKENILDDLKKDVERGVIDPKKFTKEQQKSLTDFFFSDVKNRPGKPVP